LPAAPGPQQYQATLAAERTALPPNQHISIGHLPRTYDPSHAHSGQIPTALTSSRPAGFVQEKSAFATADMPTATTPAVNAPSRHVSWNFMAETDLLQAASWAAMQRSLFVSSCGTDWVRLPEARPNDAGQRDEVSSWA